MISSPKTRLLVFLCLAFVPVPAVAAPAEPDFEIKFFLAPDKVLDAEHKPADDFAKAVGLKTANTKIAMEFLDAKPWKIHPEGWDVRIRKIEGDKGFELTYKRRIPVPPGKLAAALAQAEKEGFDAKEKDYKAQVDWGFTKQTLSFSRKKEFALKGSSGMDLPSVDDARKIAAKEIPGKLDRWMKEGWAGGILTTAHLYGPVRGKRWAGKWQGLDLDVEVWELKAESGKGFELIVEISFKEDTEAKAAGGRQKLQTFLRDRKWLIEDDVLKTEMILKRY